MGIKLHMCSASQLGASRLEAQARASGYGTAVIAACVPRHPAQPARPSLPLRLKLRCRLWDNAPRLGAQPVGWVPIRRQRSACWTEVRTAPKCILTECPSTVPQPSSHTPLDPVRRSKPKTVESRSMVFGWEGGLDEAWAVGHGAAWRGTLKHLLNRLLLAALLCTQQLHKPSGPLEDNGGKREWCAPCPA